MTLQEITIARRVRIDALIKVGALLIISPESLIAFRSLQMAKHSLGNVLKELGGEVPYNAVSDVSLIPPTADTAESGAFELSEDHLENINAIREAIEVEKNAFEMEYHLVFSQYKPSLVRNFIFEHYNHLTQAKNWYGEELASLREKHKEAKVKTKISELANDDLEQKKTELITSIVEELNTPSSDKKKKSATKRNVKTEDDK